MYKFLLRVRLLAVMVLTVICFYTALTSDYGLPLVNLVEGALGLYLLVRIGGIYDEINGKKTDQGED